ncbi:conserved hypothetical protein [Bathymodiolus platifrons methanotrophic gill symbiont]|uniref:hypothetical protein n=1 Tax=Bathymodiolus platifrons methanotrophic gill symbiont TaxID=113268 RepID=UPI000B41DD3F|nr:hypothetical protein [Bathymodiolus platifrons methanotrophic gill symbiont]TXL00916.1 hypothetical protein BMR02_04540 [Methylococcaceae bacterium HT1]TXL00975.1 hypothetical protein BMR11_01455 [Methylococcaceae bacterium CS5]TXL07038.1 hypothetical protein BMR07_05790 [Methylococcaceae bacterium CS1]TXL15532.1 hypothetical protein BMR05_03365 [Methylococcaceae bacterium HT4]TXL18107.1 hypothetical protein BMR04_02895 [Methylococcaceae bacterium HT3]TXL20020.1 hypothetical protein BMR06_
MSEEIINLEESTTIAYEKLRENMPSIGFISRKKRVKGYIQLTEIAQYMITNEEITEEAALLILSVMMRKCSDFQKAAMMTALSLNTIGKNILSAIGLKFILEVRKNLNLPSTHHSKNESTTPDEKNEQD